MKLSARNVLKGRVVRGVRGAPTGHVKLDIGRGVIGTASVTMEAIRELRLKKGDRGRHRGEGVDPEDAEAPWG